VRVGRLASDAHVPITTALRWIDQFVGAGLVRRQADRERPGTVFFVLTDAGSTAMEDYFVALQLGWAEADAPEWKA
jgi:DNA-binding MarR family transcriptional regulator